MQLLWTTVYLSKGIMPSYYIGIFTTIRSINARHHESPVIVPLKILDHGNMVPKDLRRVMPRERGGNPSLTRYSMRLV